MGNGIDFLRSKGIVKKKQLYIYMCVLCSSVIIIIIHKNTSYYGNPFIIFIMYVQSQMTIIYIIYTQHFIKLLYSSPNLFLIYNTNIVQYSIVYCNRIYPYSLIYIDSGLPYYTCLNILTNQIFIYFPQHAMMMFCFIVIITYTYRNR